TVDLTDVNVNASTPPNWEVEFEQKTIPVLKAGQTSNVKATIKAPKDAIAGDYATTFSAKTAEASSNANIRMSVKTSTTWGLDGIAIILDVISGLFYMIRKEGRR